MFYVNTNKLQSQAFSDVFYYFISTYVLSHTEELQTHPWLCLNCIEKFSFDPAWKRNPTIQNYSCPTFTSDLTKREAHPFLSLPLYQKEKTKYQHFAFFQSIYSMTRSDMV